MKWLTLVIIGLFGAFLVYAEGDMPKYGDPLAPASIHVSPAYIQRALIETKTPNMVTAVLADYRSYDTFGETIVVFTAGLACLLLLAKGKSND